MTDLAAHYLEEMKRQFRGHKRMGEAAMAQLEDVDVFVTLDPESNSVAVLAKHIAGNARSRFTDFLTSDGEKPAEVDFAEDLQRPTAGVHEIVTGATLKGDGRRFAVKTEVPAEAVKIYRIDY